MPRFPEILEVDQEIETEREELAECQDSSHEIDNFISARNLKTRSRRRRVTEQIWAVLHSKKK